MRLRVGTKARHRTKSRRYRRPAPRRDRFSHGHVEHLESRQLLAVTSSFVAGVLNVSSDAAEDIAIVNDGTNVLISVDGTPAVNPGGGPAVAANTVTSLQINGFTGNFSNEIDLTGVDPALFTSLATIDVNAGSGNDTIRFGAALTTTLSQTYADAVVLTQDTVVQSTAGNIRFLDTINGDGVVARSLTIDAGTGGTRFDSDVGNIAALSSITSSGDIIMVLASSVGITTTGDQTYNHPIAMMGVGADFFVLGTGTITFGGAIVGTTFGSLADADRIVINGGSTDDTVTLGHTAGLPSFSFDGVTDVLFPNATSLEFNGGGGDDALVVDYALGNPVPSGGVLFDGQGQGPNGDRLAFNGAGNTTLYQPDATISGAGIVNVDGRTVQFTGLEPVDINGMNMVSIAPAGVDDALTISNGFDFATGAIPVMLISGTTGGIPIETVALWNNNTVSINTATNDGNDTITFNSANNAHGITNLTVFTGTGTDKIDVNGPVVVAGDVNFVSQQINLASSISGINVALGAGSGSIADLDGGANNIAAFNLIATATTGIELDTTVDTINASTSGGGSIVIRETDTVLLTSVTSADGNINITSGGTMTVINVVAGGASGDIDLETTVGNIAVGTITALGNTVRLTTPESITDSNGMTTNVSAANLFAMTGTGVALDTNVETIDADVAGTGAIFIRENDAVVLNNAITADGKIDVKSGGAMTATNVVAGGAGRDIDLETTAGDIAAGTISAVGDVVRLTKPEGISDLNAGATNVSTANLVTLAATGIELDTAVDTLNASTSGTGSIIIREIDAVVLNDVTTADGNIDVTSGGTMTAANVVAGGASRDIDMETTAGDIAVGTIAALGDTVRLTTPEGISDLNGVATNVSAANLVAMTATGVDLDTAVDTLDANSSGSGPIVVRETDAVVLNNVTTADGNIDVTSGGAMTATFVSAGGAGRDVNLETTTGGIAVVVANAVDKVSLTSAVAITDINLATPNVTAETLDARAVSGISLDTNVANIEAQVSGTGAIDLEEVNDVVLNLVTTVDGRIDVTAGGTITATFVTAGGALRDLTIFSSGGGIGAGFLSANADRIDLTAATAITDLNGMDTNLTANIAILIAGAGIGSGADKLDTTIRTLEAASGPGGVFIANTGTMIIGLVTPIVGISSTGGDIDIMTAGAMFILEDIVTTTGTIRLAAIESIGPGEQLVLANSAAIQSTTGDITLQAGDDVDLHVTTRVETTGRVTIASDVGDMDPFGTLIKLDGTITAQSADLIAGDDDDTLLINETVASQFNFSGSAIGSHTNAAFLASGRGPGNAGMNLEAGLGNDSLIINFTLPQDVAYFSDTNEPNSGVINVLNNYTLSFGGLAPIRLSGATGTLLVDASSTPATTFLTLDDNGIPDDGVMVITADGGVEKTTFSGFTNLKLRGGDGAETFTILGMDVTKPLGLGGPLARVELDGSNTQGTDVGDDVFNIRMLPGTVRMFVQGGLGNDTINVSSDAPANMGTIDPIRGPLQVDGQGGSDTLIVGDKADSTNDVATLTSSSITGMGLASGITYLNIDQLDVFFGSGRDELVLMLPLPSPVAAPLPSLIRIQGGPDDQDKLTVIGTNNPDVADEAIVGTFGSSSPIQIQEVEILHMFGYAGPDLFINNTAVPSFLVGGDGPDTLQGGSAADSIFGGDALDQLFGNDSDDFLFPDHDIVGGLLVERVLGGDLVDGGNGFDTVLALGFGDLLRFVSQSIDTGSIQDVITWLRGQFIPDTPAGRAALLNAGLAASNSESVADPSAVPPPPPEVDLSGVVFDNNLFVERAYFDYLDRDPALDPAGVQNFTAQAVAGVSIEEIRSEILGSVEYFGKGGNATNAGFIANLYADLLLRVPSQAEVNAWLSVLASGVTRGDVALLILVSAEARNVQVGEIFDQIDGILFNGVAPPPGANSVDRLAMLADFANGLTIAQAEKQLRSATAAGKQYADIGVGDAASFVVGLYRNPAILGREPIDAEIAPWLTALADGTMTRKLVAFSIVSSVEKQTKDVERIYQNFLGRGTDPGGLSHALAVLAGGGRIELIETDVLASNEYFQQQGSSNGAFVAALYLDALGRAGSAAEIAQFTTALNSGTTRGDLATLFVNSVEARTRVIGVQYQQTSGRLPTATEIATGLERFAKGETRDQILLRLVLSTGFVTT